MPRRMIDPAFWTSETVAALPVAIRYTFIGLFSNADDQGRLKAHPALLRSTIYPYDDVALGEIAAGLERLQAGGFIQLYEVEDRQYVQVCNWWKYQRPRWAWPSEHPPPPGWTDRLRYRQGNTVVESNWRDSDAGASPPPAVGAGPRACPPTPPGASPPPVVGAGPRACPPTPPGTSPPPVVGAGPRACPPTPAAPSPPPANYPAPGGDPARPGPDPHGEGSPPAPPPGTAASPPRARRGSAVGSPPAARGTALDPAPSGSDSDSAAGSSKTNGNNSSNSSGYTRQKTRANPDRGGPPAPAAADPDLEEKQRLLADFGIDGAGDLAARYPLNAIRAWVRYAGARSGDLANPQGLVVRRLKQGRLPPARCQPEAGDWRKFTQGGYPDYVE